jgi:AraC-like DNA-binding protein
MKKVPIATNHETLLEALRNIQFWLERENRARFMVAAKTLAEFKRQPLPDHIKTSVKKRRGKRVVYRKAHHAKVSRLVQAAWPDDHLSEHTQSSLGCVISGAAALRVADYCIHCQTGDFIFYPPDIPASDGTRPHFEDEDSENKCDILWIYPEKFHNDGLEYYICHSVKNKHFVSAAGVVKSTLLSCLYQELSEEIDGADREKSTFILLSAIIFLMHRQISRSNIPPPLSHPSTGTALQLMQDPVAHACAFIEEHLDANLTIESVSRRVGISSSAFTVLFKKQTNRTFNQYITEQRMEYAAALLCNSAMRLSEISAAIGITHCQFRRLAQRHWGCTPKEFRLKNMVKMFH